MLLTFPDEHAARRAVSGLHDEGIPLALLRVVPPDDGPVPPIRIARRVAAAATVVAAVVGALVLPDPAVAAPVLAAVAGGLAGLGGHVADRRRRHAVARRATRPRAYEVTCPRRAVTAQW